MSQQYRRIILVTGSHGTPLADVVKFLERHGYLTIWPGQDLDVVCYDAQGQYLYDQYRENIEVLRLNEEILAQAGIRWDEAGELVPEGFLSPEPLLKMFPPDRSVVLADPRFCYTLGAFSGLVTDVIHVTDTNHKRTAAALVEQWGWNEEHWLQQLRAYEEAFKQLRVRATELKDSDCHSYELSLRLVSLL